MRHVTNNSNYGYNSGWNYPVSNSPRLRACPPANYGNQQPSPAQSEHPFNRFCRIVGLISVVGGATIGLAIFANTCRKTACEYYHNQKLVKTQSVEIEKQRIEISAQKAALEKLHGKRTEWLSPRLHDSCLIRDDQQIADTSVQQRGADFVEAGVLRSNDGVLPGLEAQSVPQKIESTEITNYNTEIKEELQSGTDSTTIIPNITPKRNRRVPETSPSPQEPTPADATTPQNDHELIIHYI